MKILREVLDGANPSARRELDFCETIGSHLTSIENVTRFYQARDRLQNESCTIEQFTTRLNVLQTILDDEIGNAEAMLPIIAREPRIGYGHCYGHAYDEAMIRAKLIQCRRVKEIELPRFSQVVRFHVWLESP
jgi:hypothetical protein